MTKPTNDNRTNDCAPSEDWHPPSLIRVFPVHMKKDWVLSYPLSAPRRLLSDWTDAQADLSLRWAHRHFVGFVMRQLTLLHHFDWTVETLWLIYWGGGSYWGYLSPFLFSPFSFSPVSLSFLLPPTPILQSPSPFSLPPTPLHPHLNWL